MDEYEVKNYISGRVHELYYGIDMNCARTTMTCIKELLGITICTQTMDAALGMHGAGGFRAQCGLVEGGLMMIGICGRVQGKTEEDVVDACRRYAEAFVHKFGALTCRELRPGGFCADDPPHLCEKLTAESIDFTYYFIKECFY